MGIPLHRLPFLVQIILFRFMELPEKFIVATLSKRCRRLSKVLFKRLPIQLKIRYVTDYEIIMNEEKLKLNLKMFRATQSCAYTPMWNILKEIFVPSRDRELDPIDAVKSYGSLDQMALRMHEFLFEVFTIQSISLEANVVKTTAKVLDAIRICKAKHPNQTTSVKLDFRGNHLNHESYPPLHCDEVTFKDRMTVKQLIQMVPTCKRVIVDCSCPPGFHTAGLKKILAMWMDNSPIEFMKLPVSEKVFKNAMSGVGTRNVKVARRIRNRHVIRQANGKEAVVYHFVRAEHTQWIFFRTDFEEVIEADG